MLLARFTHGLGLISRIDVSGAVAYYDFDAIGSTVGLTGPAGTYVNRYSYLPFGETTTVTAGVANPFTYVGEFGVTSDGSDLLHMRHRSYAIRIGQFTSDDPLGLGGGDANLRRYVSNDPVRLIDAEGLNENLPGPVPRRSLPGPIRELLLKIPEYVWEEMEQEERAILDRIYRKGDRLTAAEWAKDNAVRRIDSARLHAWVAALRKARREGRLEEELDGAIAEAERFATLRRPAAGPAGTSSSSTAGPRTGPRPRP